MKYGETLRQRSIPAWSHYNIDYDDIKRFIKEQTTSGTGKSVAIPGRADEQLLEFENSLFKILHGQHERIDLFVRSKAGEIRRRLDHSEKQLRSLNTRTLAVVDLPIPVAQLERFGRLENEILKAGEEIKSLARFNGAQRTAFRKLLKKYKKWTGSTHLEERFREEVTDDPKSFGHLDLGSLLDDYSSLLQRTRTLYEARVRPVRADGPGSNHSPGSAVTAALQAAIDSGSKVEIDSAVANVPLGESGHVASYFIHPECTVELQMLLLQHCTYCLARSRVNSVASPITPTSRNGQAEYQSLYADYFNLVADDPARFVQEQSALTFADREHSPGSLPQRAKFSAIWNNEEEARVSFRPVHGRPESTSIKRKSVAALFDRTCEFHSKGEHDVLEIRRAMEKDDCIRPLYRLSACRSRLIGLKNSADGMVVATLDTSITIQPLDKEATSPRKTIFPFGVLTVRQEGRDNGTLISALDASHLVERVRGFSMEYHAVWEVCEQPGISQPPWASILSRDIRKLPPPTSKHSTSSMSGSAAWTRSGSTPSEPGGTDSATAVETGRETWTLDLEAAPLRSFRKKRHRPQFEEPAVQPQQKYWSEYDHPEDGNEDDVYVIYIDPDERSALELFMHKLRSLFVKPLSEDPCRTPVEDESSSDEDDDTTPATENTALVSKPARTRKTKAYGAFASNDGAHDVETSYAHPTTGSLPQTTTLCYIASLAILTVAYFLAYTGKHKYHYAVDAGILLAVLFSVIFAVTGYVLLWRSNEMAGRSGRRTGWVSWTLATVVLIIDAIASGGLLAWIWTFGRQ